MGSITLSQISNGDALDASTVDQNFDAVADEVNGNLDDSNIKGSANINGGKLLAGTYAGFLGYASRATDFATTSVTSDVDVTDLSVTVTVPSLAANRRLRLTFFARSLSATGAAGTFVTAKLKEGTTTLGESVCQVDTNAKNMNGYCSCVLSPSAGSHTYKVAVQQSAAGTLTVGAAATGASYLLAEVI